MVHRLPPLNPVRNFVAASQHASFSKAAEAMNVTQAAVSRQIGVLEAYLGVELFHRNKRNIELTAAGRHYATSMQKAFDIISNATEDVMFETEHNTLNIRAYTTFASLWLIPRLKMFRALHPDLLFNLTTSAAPVDFEHENVDVAIQIGTPTEAGVKFEPLFPVVLRPVCAPGLAKELKLESPADLARAPILQSVLRRGDWRAWLKKAEVAGVDLRGCLMFESSGLAYRAAIEGMGVAMGHVPLMNVDVAHNRLVAPFDVVLRRRYAYCLVYRDRHRLPKKIRLFRDWLHTEASSLTKPGGAFEPRPPA